MSLSSRLPRTLAAAFVLSAVLPVPSAWSQTPNAIVASDARLEVLWDEGTHTEGVAVAPDGVVYFCDVTPTSAQGKLASGHIYRYDARARKAVVFRSPANQANGLKFDTQGRLLAAESADGGGRRITRTEMATGKAEIIATRYKMKPLNSPNDVTVDAQGVVYFTDPRYDGKEPIEQPVQGVYRLDADNTPRLIIGNIVPNGLVVTPDGKTLYVAEHDLGTTDQSANSELPRRNLMRILAYDLFPDGSARMRQVFKDYGNEMGADGLALDSSGNLYAAVRSNARKGVAVYTPTGTETAFIPTPELPTNLAFGRDNDSKSLYITAGKSLYRIRTQITGYTPGETATAK